MENTWGVRNKSHTPEDYEWGGGGWAVNRWEGEGWRREVEGMTTLRLYRNKVSIGDEEIYCNRLGAVILFQYRTNTLRLKWRQGFVGGAVDCPLCGAVEETVAHFVTKCVVLEGVRERFGVTREDVLEEILLLRGRTQEKVERSIALLEEIWRRRRREMDRQMQGPAHQ